MAIEWHEIHKVTDRFCASADAKKQESQINPSVTQLCRLVTPQQRAEERWRAWVSPISKN
jgi:hypothetical protein